MSALRELVPETETFQNNLRIISFILALGGRRFVSDSLGDRISLEVGSRCEMESFVGSATTGSELSIGGVGNGEATDSMI